MLMFLGLVSFFIGVILVITVLFMNLGITMILFSFVFFAIGTVYLNQNKMYDLLQNIRNRMEAENNEDEEIE